MRLTAALLAGVGLWVAAASLPAEASGQKLRDDEAPPALDAGVPRPPPSAEDREVIENLELLEHLDEVRDLGLLDGL